MARFGFALGLLAIAAGAALAAYGSPYYMLDWGGTLVLSGLVAIAGGVVTLMLGAILQELRRIGDRFAAVMPAAAPPEAIPAAMARAEPALESAAVEPAASKPAVPEPAVSEPAVLEPAALELEPAPQAAAPSTPADPSKPVPPAAASTAALAPSPPAAPLAAVSAAAAPAAAGGLATAAASILSSITHRRRDGDGDMDGPMLRGALSGEARDAAGFGGRAQMEVPGPRLAADPYVKVDEAVRALRTEAGQAGMRGSGSELAADDLDGLRSDLLSAPPSQDGLDEPDRDPATIMPGEPAADGGEPSAGGAGRAPQAPLQADDGEDAAAIEVRDAAAAPSASEEGVIAAYTVGDSSYTMFADGRIRAATPDGELTFAGMEELKEHMARKRLGG